MSDRRSEAKEFHLKEFDTLRKEISDAETRFVTIIQYVLALSGIIYSFLLGIDKFNTISQKLTNHEFYIIAVFPTITSIVGAVINAAIAIYVRKIRKYLTRVEQIYALPELGWEEFLYKITREDNFECHYCEYIDLCTQRVSSWALNPLSSTAAYLDAVVH